MYNMVFLTIHFMRKWGMNIFNSDEVKYTFLTRKLMTVLKGHVLFFMSTVTSSFRLQLYLGFVCVFTKVTFVADIFFFLLRRTNCWSGDRESPARSLANVVRKRCAGVQDSVDSTVPLFRRPHIPCLEMSVHVFMCLSLAVMSQSNFSSVPTLTLGLEDERMGCIPII